MRHEDKQTLRLIWQLMSCFIFRSLMLRLQQRPGRTLTKYFMILWERSGEERSRMTRRESRRMGRKRRRSVKFSESSYMPDKTEVNYIFPTYWCQWCSDFKQLYYLIKKVQQDGKWFTDRDLYTKFNTQHSFHFLGQVLFCVDTPTVSNDCQLIVSISALFL